MAVKGRAKEPDEHKKAVKPETGSEKVDMNDPSLDEREAVEAALREQ